MFDSIRTFLSRVYVHWTRQDSFKNEITDLKGPVPDLCFVMSSYSMSSGSQISFVVSRIDHIETQAGTLHSFWDRNESFDEITLPIQLESWHPIRKLKRTVYDQSWVYGSFDKPKVSKSVHRLTCLWPLSITF